MEGQDIGSKDLEDIESMLAKAAAIEKSIIAASNDGCIAAEKNYSDLASWLKQVDLFEDAPEPIIVAREKPFKRSNKKPKNLLNKIDFEINMLPLAKITYKINLSRHDSSDGRAVASNLEDPGSITHSGSI